MSRAAILVVAWAAVSSPARAQDATPDARVLQLESICNEAVATTGVRSVAAAVSLGGETLLERSFRAPDAGERLDERTDAVRDVGPAFEPLVALAVARLVSRDQLALDDRVAVRLPRMEAWDRPVTVEQLLTHTSGVTSYRDFARARPEISRDELLAWIAQQPLDAEPGACFEYSESNVLLAAAIVEHAADMPLESALGALVFEPFALERWSWAPFEPSIRGRFEVDLIGDALAVDPPWAHVGAGTPRANLRELVQLASALWHRGATGADELPILGADVSLPDGSKPPLAWGWTRSRAGPRAELSFGGRSGDSRIHVTAVPDVELVVALASSRSNESLDALARKLVRAVLEEPQAEVLDLETPDDERAACTGAYYVGCTRIAIEERGDALWLVPPAENAYRLRFQGAHRFVSAADVDVRIEFEVRDARATGFVIDVRGSRMYARRVE